MMYRIKEFLKREDGAVTVDWVVLTAAVVTLGTLAGTTIATGVEDLSANTKTYMDNLKLFE